VTRLSRPYNGRLSDAERGGSGRPRTGFEDEIFNTEISDLIRDVDGEGAQPVAAVELSATAASMERSGPKPAAAAPRAVVSTARYVRRRRFPFWILWLLLSLAIAAGGAFALWHHVLEERLTAEPTGVSPGAIGVRIDSVPPGATVWLLLGSSPVETPWLDTGRAHRLRVEHPDHELRVVEVPPSVFPGGPRPRARLHIALAEEPPARGDREDGERGEHGEGGEGGDVAGSGRGRIEVHTDPARALVWLEAGTTPDLEITAAEPWDQRRIRVELEGHEPAVHTIRDRDFGSGGWASVRLRLQAHDPPGDEGGAL
jgi:hypothetical protein